jgi:hypothetical protein
MATVIKLFHHVTILHGCGTLEQLHEEFNNMKFKAQKKILK